jgi:hypothetical protein
MSTNPDPATIGAEIESLTLKVGALSDSHARECAQELVRLLMSLYGAGLSRMLDVIRTESGGPQAVLERFADDGLIGSLLVLHDLHPHSLGTRVARAVAALQPYLPGQMMLTVLSVSDETVRLRVAPRPSSQSGVDSLRASLERAIQEVAPEVGAIEIDGLETGALIQIVRRSAAAGQQSTP